MAARRAHCPPCAVDVEHFGYSKRRIDTPAAVEARPSISKRKAALSRDATLYIDDMIEACRRVMQYTEGFDRAQLVSA